MRVRVLSHRLRTKIFYLKSSLSNQGPHAFCVVEAIRRKSLVLSSEPLVNLAKNLGERYIRVMKKRIKGRGRKRRGTKEPLDESERGE